MPPKKAHDHWSFLDEMEAPMWVDLTIEADYTVQDVAEEWFNTTHLFHQCSSNQLKSSFSHRCEGSLTKHFDLQGPLSPKLPSSVSRSRGKDYKAKKPGHDNCQWTHKSHPLKDIGSNSSHQVVGCCQEIRPKVALTKPRGSSITRAGLVCENKESHSLKPKLPLRSSLSGVVTSSTSTKTSATDASCLTIESSQLQQQNVVDVTSQAFSNSRQLLSIARRSLRKSCITRQVSRMEIRNDTYQSRGCGSSSGKSSVGSSSIPGRSPRSALAEDKETTPDSRNVARMGQKDRCKSKPSNISKMPQVLVLQGKATSGRKSLTDFAKPAGARAAKVKVHQSLSGKAMRPLGVKGQELISSAKDKDTTKVSSSKQLMGNGKENASSKMALTEKCTHRSSGNGGVIWGQKMKKPVLGRRVLADSKDKLKDQIGGQTNKAANRGLCVR